MKTWRSVIVTLVLFAVATVAPSFVHALTVQTNGPYVTWVDTHNPYYGVLSLDGTVSGGSPATSVAWKVPLPSDYYPYYRGPLTTISIHPHDTFEFARDYRLHNLGWGEPSYAHKTPMPITLTATDGGVTVSDTTTVTFYTGNSVPHFHLSPASELPLGSTLTLNANEAFVDVPTGWIRNNTEFREHHIISYHWSIVDSDPVPARYWPWEPYTIFSVPLPWGYFNTMIISTSPVLSLTPEQYSQYFPAPGTYYIGLALEYYEKGELVLPPGQTGMTMWERTVPAEYGYTCWRKITVLPPGNARPTIDPIGDKVINEGETLSFTLNAIDGNGDALTLTVSDLPAGAQFDPATGTFTWTPGYNQAGFYRTIFTATDSGNPPLSSFLADTIIFVGDVNRPPVLSLIGNKSAIVDQPLQFTVTATDPDGNALTYSASNLPIGATFDQGTATFIWTPTYQQKGNYSVLFTVTDNGTPAKSASETVIISAGELNRPPVLSPIGNMTVYENETLQFTVTATDPDGDSLTFSVDNLPGGATFDTATGQFSWTPSYEQAGSYPNVIFTVTDNGAPAAAASGAITIYVGNSNLTPTLDPIGNKTVKEGETLQFTVTATDPDNDPLTFLCAGKVPEGVMFDNATGQFSWTPSYGQAGNYTVDFYVTDYKPKQWQNPTSVTITVGNVNRPPVLGAIGDKTATENELLQFTLTAQDPDGDTLTFSADNLPAGASFDPASRTFSWTPGYDQYSETPYWVQFTVTDNGDPMGLDMRVINITVNNVNRLPVFWPTHSQVVKEGELLQFSVSATDYDGDTVYYSVGPMPSGASFNASARVFSWTPDHTQAGNHLVTFYATDNWNPAAKASFDVAITVGDVPTPAEQIDSIIDVIVTLPVTQDTKNSYLANTKNAGKFIETGMATPAVNQLNAFIDKVKKDIAQGKIDAATGNALVANAMELITILKK